MGDQGMIILYLNYNSTEPDEVNACLTLHANHQTLNEQRAFSNTKVTINNEEQATQTKEM